MRLSKYNIFSGFKDSENYFILNLLTGNADILAPEEADIIKRISTGTEAGDSEFTGLLKSKGYISDPEEERKLYNRKYLDSLDERDKEEIQLFFVPNYSCNFTCSYCYQDEYENITKPLTGEVIDAFFSFVNSNFAGRRKYLTVFGGEPLLNSERQKEIISRLLDQARENDMDACIVTNGYYLKDYDQVLENARIREIQVTLDGTADIHNKRRHLKGGGHTFEKITGGIDWCLQSGISVNLRVVIDKDNIDNLPDLASYAVSRGWTSNPLFKTQIGRNYELHHCQSHPDRLFDRLSLYEKLYELIKQYPVINEFHRPAYSVARFIFENGELPEPLFDSCPACKSEWAFDYTGNIYSCTATVGKKEESLGTYFPQVTLRNDLIAQWQERDVTAISECRDCSVQLACGGGCGSVAQNRTGKICSPDCRPVKELLELGFGSYFNEKD